MNYKLLKDVPVRLAANYIIKSVIQDGAKGCEIIISGKLKQQRAKTMKFKQGYMICTGQPKNDYIDVAVRHVFFKQVILSSKLSYYIPLLCKFKLITFYLRINYRVLWVSRSKLCYPTNLIPPRSSVSRLLSPIMSSSTPPKLFPTKRKSELLSINNNPLKLKIPNDLVIHKSNKYI